MTACRPFSNILDFIPKYIWYRTTVNGPEAGTFGTFYSGDTPLHPNNMHRDNGPSDTDIRNRFALSFVYQPQLFKDNKWSQHLINDWLFSGGFVGSGDPPISLSMTGTVYNGTGTNYVPDGYIYSISMTSNY